MEDDAIMLKQKKRKVAIDPDQEDEEPQVKSITTKTQEEKPDRENFEHKTNGDKPKEVKKQPEKKEEAKPDKSDAKNASPTKPRPPADKDKQNVKKDTDQKPLAKPKPAASDSDKKASEGNGQVQKKAPEERKSSQKPPAKKKPEPESESGSESDESESEDEKPKKKQVAKPKPKPSPKQKTKKDSEPGGKKVVGKDVLVYDVLKRWWYCLPDWPPVGYDYSAELEKRKLRKVDQKYWRIEPEKDAKDFTKVYEIPSYPGVFKNSKGERIDLRPKDTCPSYEVFKKKSIPDLLDLKVTALKNQIEALEKSVVVDDDLLKELKKDLAVAEKTRAKMAEKTDSNKNKV